MISIHIHIPSNGKWHTRHFNPGRLKIRSAIIDFDNIITNLRNTRSWEVKVGYNLLRELHANS